MRQQRLRARWLAAVTLFLFLMAGCSPPAVAPLEQDAPATPALDTLEEDKIDQGISPDKLPADKASECPDLDSQLRQLIQAPDPLALARQLGLKVQDDKVQVLLTLADEDTKFLQEFGIEPGTQSGVQVQAFVPVDQLCDLANTAEVLAIRPSAQAITP